MYYILSLVFRLAFCLKCEFYISYTLILRRWMLTCTGNSWQPRGGQATCLDLRTSSSGHTLSCWSDISVLNVVVWWWELALLSPFVFPCVPYKMHVSFLFWERERGSGFSKVRFDCSHVLSCLSLCLSCVCAVVAPFISRVLVFFPVNFSVFYFHVLYF